MLKFVKFIKFIKPMLNTVAAKAKAAYSKAIEKMCRTTSIF